ncbi:hypothetical protein FOXB_16189 [Fusarium oxysporum f. sp. conglutinans Fo5176]|uniref:Zn(2)-C6 fungal-type domain-containing protein n=1 Tax=Fusarium oxysporum (strain Fo5176) TaxID=660025 RepID=F9GC06_FUSOF|nr:hypothetical protein FOXB_16189 [Fusarium oxysporum f. sp. conglutinans Fo5176]
MRPIVPYYQENSALKPPVQPSRILPPRVKKAARRWERAGKPKSRSGCGTCKIRRVKCDAQLTNETVENKPICFRCAKDDSTESDGFASGTESPDTSAASTHTSPETETSETSLSTAPTPEPHCCNWPDVPGSSSFCPSSHSVVYFEHFHHHVNLNNGVFSSSELFSSIVLQESLQDECIRNAVFAIGSFLFSGFILSQTSTRMTMADQHRQASLQFYTSALTTFRSHVQSSNEVTHRWLLLMTLLLVIYELLNGDFDAADRLLVSALEVLRPSLATLPSPSVMNSDMLAHTSIQIIGESGPLFIIANLNTSLPTTQETAVVFIHWEDLSLHPDTEACF